MQWDPGTPIQSDQKNLEYTGKVLLDPMQMDPGTPIQFDQKESKFLCNWECIKTKDQKVLQDPGTPMLLDLKTTDPGKVLQDSPGKSCHKSNRTVERLRWSQKRKNVKKRKSKKCKKKEKVVKSRDRSSDGAKKKDMLKKEKG